MSAAAKNLEAISKAIDQHNSNCPSPASEIRMNGFELERLGWSDIRGLPLVADPNIGTGRFRVVCGNDDHQPERVQETGAQIPVEASHGPRLRRADTNTGTRTPRPAGR